MSTQINLKSNLFRLAIALSLGAFAATGFAATDNLSVTASISNNCTIDASSTLAFGAYDPIVTNKSTALDGTGSVSVTCTDQAAWALSLGQGANADVGSTDAVPLRRLTDATDFLAYFLYQDASRTVVWGNTAATDVDGTGTGAAQANTVYGRVTADQQSQAGSYTDTVVATVTF